MNVDLTEDKVIRGNPLAIVPPDQPQMLPDGTPLVSGPVPEGREGPQVPRPASIVPEGGVMFAGVAGGAFAAYGTFGKRPGIVVVGNVQATVTSWRQNSIKGLLSRITDVNAEVVITDGDGNVVVRPALHAAVTPTPPVPTPTPPAPTSTPTPPAPTPPKPAEPKK